MSEPVQNDNKLVWLASDLSISEANLFRRMCRDDGVSEAVGVRAAIELWQKARDARKAGYEISIIETFDNGYREVSKVHEF